MSHNYKIIKNLASGAYGRVDLVEVKSNYRTVRGHQFKKGDQAAMKTFITGEGGVTQDAVVEVDILSRVNHPNVLGAYDSFPKMSPADVCEGANVVLPLAIGDLHEFSSESLTLQHLFQILCGVHYLHRNFIIHNDLKPQNILAFGGEKKMPEGWTIQKSRSTGEEYYANTITRVTTFDRPFPVLPENSILKVADFGISNIVEGRPSAIDSVTQTLWWRPPEILDEDGVSGIHSYESDIWALGVIFYEYSVGLNPFRASGIRETLAKIYGFLADKGWRNDPVFKSGEFKDLDKLISKMLDADPLTRITAEEALKSDIFNRFHCPVSKMESVPWDIGINPEIIPANRTKTVKWMRKVVQAYRLQNLTFFLAVDIFDRFLSTDRNVERDNYQLVAITSISLAAKLLETGGIPPMEVYVQGMAGIYTADHIKNMECTVMEKLEYRIFRPTLNLLFPESSVEDLKRCITDYPSPNEISDCLGPVAGRSPRRSPGGKEEVRSPRRSPGGKEEVRSPGGKGEVRSPRRSPGGKGEVTPGPGSVFFEKTSSPSGRSRHAFAAEPLEKGGPVTDLPGIGSENADALKRMGITTSKQLFGVFMRFNDPEDFADFLEGRGFVFHPTPRGTDPKADLVNALQDKWTVIKEM